MNPYFKKLSKEELLEIIEWMNAEFSADQQREFNDFLESDKQRRKILGQAIEDNFDY